jgi:glycosyltransferase involved in cell wall biosynthesis
MASGLAVVACDHAAAGQLIRHGENGLLARADDTPEFCRVARRIAGDWVQLRELGTAARATAMRLDWGRIVAAVEHEYAAAMGSPEAEPVTALTSPPPWQVTRPSLVIPERSARERAISP